MAEWNVLKAYWQEHWKQKLRKKQQLHHKCGKKIKRIHIHGKKLEMRIDDEHHAEFPYLLHVKLFIEDGEYFYHEEVMEHRVAEVENDVVTFDKEVALPIREIPEQIEVDVNDSRFDYDRRVAVQYAERWWNDANPAYQYFADNDCTNYISQCLRAGGAPMHGAPNRSKGWWYQRDNWSFSWSVANSFRWYLSGATSGLKGTEVSDPEKLSPGDVICYDFQGDGRWDHTTIVVAKDSQHMPLVNAHTNNSRHRYWTYEDSAAWTPNCQYRFFHIG
ncbi:amidase domain-containing protein [Gracilibacillus sp. S3-1-1]|uniref:Amidase domain-containing protein n=1 Tax=Gracilibacillus pellucidus TaxID=3095368 RepID=A0ACC6M0L8_9BACI|nr:amidase domain-containing protein [Gracilibacillus sp. S3-1-1]MDX8044494.1 amidase domain-containing protein [Gracilibacillus sp. S3-1-1]